MRLAIPLGLQSFEFFCDNFVRLFVPVALFFDCFFLAAVDNLLDSSCVILPASNLRDL